MRGEKFVDYKYSVRKQERFRMKDLCTHFRKSEEKEIKHKIYNRKETIKTMEINRMYTNRKINETKSHFFEKND